MSKWTSEFDPMYSRIYHGFTERYKLKAEETILLAIIISYHLGGRTCWHSNASYAKLTHTSIPTVIRYLGRLKRLGLIKLRPPKSQFGTNQYGLGSVGEETLKELEELIPRSKRMRHSD
ncbi:MAG: helix-turn-helix domain-containing protein [Minisyncoccota bacterium]